MILTFIFTIMRVMGVTKGNPAQNIFLVTFAPCMITFASLLMERTFIFTANQVQFSFQFPFVVGSVPSCYVAHQLYEEHIEKPLCGVILHASLYSGRAFYRFVSLGSSFTCGCLIRKSDPYNNAKMIKNIEVELWNVCNLVSDLPYPWRGR